MRVRALMALTALTAALAPSALHAPALASLPELPDVGAGPPACPSEFGMFLRRFESDLAFQVENVVFPLRASLVDADEGAKPVTHTEQVPRDAYGRGRVAYFPTAQLQAERKLHRRIEESAPDERIVRFAPNGTLAFSIAYHFTRIRGCWRLTFLDDRSLHEEPPADLLPEGWSAQSSRR
jgi:hypothetical protein